MSIWFLVLAIVLFFLLPTLHLLYEQKNSRLLKFVDFLFWLKDDLFTRKGIQCLICDKKNRRGAFILIWLFFLLPVIGLGCLFCQLFTKIIIPYEVYLIIITVIFILILVFILEWRVFPTIISFQDALHFPHSDNLTDLEEHVGIILPHYSEPLRNFFLSDNITLLVKGFQNSNKKYRIYQIFQPRDFEIAYYNDKVSELWILGHGDHGGVCYGNNHDDYIEYSKLNNLEHPKKFIVQLHCNNGIGESLKDINGCQGFVSMHMRTSFQNRCYIINTFNTSQIMPDLDTTTTSP